MSHAPTPEATPPAEDAPNPIFPVFLLTVFIDLLGFGIVLPVMPRQAEPFLTALGLSPAAQGAAIGILFSSFSLMQFLFSPVWGRLSDRVGRRPIAGASVGTAAAVIADCTTPANRARGMALIGIAFGAGFTLGPLVAYVGLRAFSARPWGVGVLASLLSAWRWGWRWRRVWP